jgi:thymidylate synthase
LYNNHMEQARLQMTRTPFALPAIKQNPSVKNIFDFDFEDIGLEGYQSHPAIKAAVAV